MIGIIVGIAAVASATMAIRVRYPRSAIVPIGKLVGDESFVADLPCPWCKGPTAEDDHSCPSCGKSFDGWMLRRIPSLGIVFVGTDRCALGFGQPNTPRRVSTRGGNWNQRLHPLRVNEPPLKHLHPTKRSTGDKLDFLHLKMVQQCNLQPDDVTH